MKETVFLATGGTGGHVFPAEALANDLQSTGVVKPVFLGGGLGTNQYFGGCRYPFYDVACGSFSLRRPIRATVGAQRLLKGVRQSIRILRQVRPRLIVGFGSYYSLPPLLAARMLRIPIFLYDGNALPGRVTRLMSRFAVGTGLAFSRARRYVRGEVSLVSPLVRESTAKDKVSPEEGRLHFGLQPELNTLLIFGGSQGAQALNEQSLQALPAVYRKVVPRFQVIHFTGSEASAHRLQHAYEELGIKHYVAAFESRIGLAWSAASLAFCRAGAGTVAEAQYFAVPSLFVPYPYATDDHQLANALAIESDVGGGICIPQQELDTQGLVTQLTRLLTDENGVLSRMHNQLHRAQLDLQQSSCSHMILNYLNKKVCPV